MVCAKLLLREAACLHWNVPRKASPLTYMSFGAKAENIELGTEHVEL